MPLTQGDLLTVPEALAGRTFGVTCSNLVLDMLEVSARAADGSMHWRSMTPHEQLQVLATLAALTTPGGWSIHRIHPGNRVAFTEEELRGAGFTVEAHEPLRGIIVLHRAAALPPAHPSAATGQPAEPAAPPADEAELGATNEVEGAVRSIDEAEDDQ